MVVEKRKDAVLKLFVSAATTMTSNLRGFSSLEPEQNLSTLMSSTESQIREPAVIQKAKSKIQTNNSCSKGVNVYSPNKSNGTYVKRVKIMRKRPDGTEEFMSKLDYSTTGQSSSENINQINKLFLSKIPSGESKKYSAALPVNSDVEKISNLSQRSQKLQSINTNKQDQLNLILKNIAASNDNVKVKKDDAICEDLVFSKKVDNEIIQKNESVLAPIETIVSNEETLLNKSKETPLELIKSQSAEENMNITQSDSMEMKKQLQESQVSCKVPEENSQNIKINNTPEQANVLTLTSPPRSLSDFHTACKSQLLSTPSLIPTDAQTAVIAKKNSAQHSNKTQECQIQHQENKPTPSPSQTNNKVTGGKTRQRNRFQRNINNHSKQLFHFCSPFQHNSISNIYVLPSPARFSTKTISIPHPISFSHINNVTGNRVSIIKPHIHTQPISIIY